jgi:hypothetical protein
MDWHFLLIELLLFLAVGWLVFLTLLFYWLVFCGGVVPFSATTWLVISLAAWIAVNALVYYLSWRESKGRTK